MSDLAPRAFTAADAVERAALLHLVTAYCHAIDRRDYALVRSLYCDDAIDDHGAMFCGGPNEYVAWLPGMLANWAATDHRIGNALFLIDGDEAEGEVSCTAWHRTSDGSRDVIAHGRYLDYYKKTAGVWRFHRRSLVLDWFEERSVVQSGGGIDDGVVVGAAGADDPVYQRLSRFAAQRHLRTLSKE